MNKFFERISLKLPMLALIAPHKIADPYVSDFGQNWPNELN